MVGGDLTPPKSRREFSGQEVAYIRARAGLDSWGQIARDLGKLFPNDNGGKRSRSAVYKIATSDPTPLISKTIRIPKQLSDQAAIAGIDISDLVQKAITSALKRQKTF